MGSTEVIRTCSLCTAKDPCTSNARTQVTACSPAVGERPMPELAAPKRPAKPYVYVQPQMETAAVKKSITVVEESESHTGKHNRGIIRPCLARQGLVPARQYRSCGTQCRLVPHPCEDPGWRSGIMHANMVARGRTPCKHIPYVLRSLSCVTLISVC
jgi:hypothetical protein